MAKAKREVEVVAIRDVSPNMRRISFGGDSLANFPVGQESGYVKFVFSPVAAGGRPRLRSYTIRHFDPTSHQLDVDFSLHDVGGPATAWANCCKVGDIITMSGPGPTKLVPLDADWFFFVGDMSSLPAIAANIDSLPNEAKGYVVIEILSQEDKLNLKQPSAIEICWVVNPHPTKGTSLIDVVIQKEWLAGTPAIWSACEFGKMKLLRDYFIKERNVASEHRYISSYWKIRASDEEHKMAKKADT